MKVHPLTQIAWTGLMLNAVVPTSGSRALCMLALFVLAYVGMAVQHWSKEP